MATLVPLAPALNVAFWIGTLLAERLLYIPSIGICLGAGYLLAQPFRAFLLYDCGSSFSPSTPVTESSKTSSTRTISPSVAVLRRGNTVRTFAYALLILAVVGNMSLHSYQRSLDWLDE